MDLPPNPMGPSMWWVATIPIAVVLLAWVVNAQVALVALSASLAAAFVARAIRREPHPVALVVRRRGVDLTILGLLSVLIGVLALGGTPGL